MWLVLALSSAVLSGAVAVIIKYALKETSPELSLFIRTAAVLVFTLFFAKFKKLNLSDLVFIILSGAAMAISWLCYYRALNFGRAGIVACVERLSTPLTVVGASLFLKETFGPARFISVVFVTFGILIMLEKDDLKNIGAKSSDKDKKKKGWLCFALASALFTASSVLLAKAGLKNIDSDLSLTLRTVVVLIISFGVVLYKKELKGFCKISPKTLVTVILSGFVTGFSWLCYYRALALRDAAIIQSLDRLGVLVSVALSALIFGERPNKRQLVGLFFLTAGILFPTLG